MAAAMAGHNGNARSHRRRSRRRSTRRGVRQARARRPEDERIEVGVAIVGGGPAGLACANRLLQLLADDAETLEKLGEVPVAVIEKAKTCGGHNLSGAVMRPGPLQELFPDLTREEWRKEGFAFGEVDKEAVYLMPSGSARSASRRRRRSTTTATRWSPWRRSAATCSSRPRRPAPTSSPRRRPPSCIVEDGRCVGVRSGDKGRGKDGEPLGNFEPGTDVQRAGHRAGRGLLGPPHRRGDPRVRPRRRPRAAGVGARREGGLEGPEAARPGDPHARAVAAARSRRSTARSAARGSTR